MLQAMTSRQRTAIHVALVGALVLLTTSFAPREAEADPLLDVGKGDVSVQADKLEVDVATGSAVLTGQVVLSKGDMNVRCPRVELKFDTSPHLNWAKGSGGVVADVRGVHGEAPEVELDLIDDRCVVTSALPLEIEAHWREHAGHWLATARASPRGTEPNLRQGTDSTSST